MSGSAGGTTLADVGYISCHAATHVRRRVYNCAAVGAFPAGVVADASNSNGCTTDTILKSAALSESDTDTTCDVKCDTSTHVAQTATVTCAPDAVSGDAVSGLPTCLARAACSTITCASGTVADSSAQASLCAGATCDNSGADNDLCCNSDVARLSAATAADLRGLVAVVLVSALACVGA